MRDTENTIHNESQNEEVHWAVPVVFSVIVALLFSVPVLYFLGELVGTVLMFFVTPIGYVWETLGNKWVGFLVVGCLLTSGCLIFKGSPDEKFAGCSLLLFVFVFMVASISAAPGRYLNDLLKSTTTLNKLSPSEVQKVAEIKNTTIAKQEVEYLVAGDWGVEVSKSACESFQRRTSESSVFNERYVLFVNNQRSKPGAPVECKWFSLNQLKVAYNARYAPNGLVAQLEAFEASRKK